MQLTVVMLASSSGNPKLLLAILLSFSYVFRSALNFDFENGLTT